MISGFFFWLYTADKPELFFTKLGNNGKIELLKDPTTCKIWSTDAYEFQS